MSPAVEVWSPNHWTAREFPAFSFTSPFSVNFVLLFILLYGIRLDVKQKNPEYIKNSYTLIIKRQTLLLKMGKMDFSGGAVVKNSPANAGGTGSVSGPGRSYMLWSS